ncbi:hypothetical protein DQ04_08201040 [Trypanosoma grayi]|uniref:hypothetical protein n=1 Tax=Trypanosoma grayi TaxID=71804 RepID=UPI0004F43FB4|nr:hypothetical protein DQ04_08201040 [Trypanosoma grayi]KEG08024.1 hypothetical protein DQ04_08201040 [Trypanosoma grayi]
MRNDATPPASGVVAVDSPPLLHGNRRSALAAEQEDHIAIPPTHEGSGNHSVASLDGERLNGEKTSLVARSSGVGDTWLLPHGTDASSLFSFRQRSPLWPSPRFQGVATEVMQLQQGYQTERLLRYIIELERDNDLLRLALLEGSERRTRQRFCRTSSSDPVAMVQSKEQVLQSIMEVEKSVKAQFQVHLDRLEKQSRQQQHGTGEVEAGLQGRSTSETYEATLAQSERRRWKEHIRHTLEELALLHREKELQAVSAVRGSLPPAAHDNISIHVNMDDDNDGDADTNRHIVDRRIVDLEKQVTHWKEEAKKERARATQYRQEALKELQRMHAIYKRALGEGDPSDLLGDVVPAAGKEVDTPADGLASPGRAGVGEELYGGTSVGSAAVMTPNVSLVNSPSSSHVVVEEKHDVPNASPTEDALRHDAGTSGAAQQLWAHRKRSYHSDVYLRRESVATNTDDVPVTLGA